MEQGVEFGIQPPSHQAPEQGEFISALCNQRLVEEDIPNEHSMSSWECVSTAKHILAQGFSCVHVFFD